MLEDARSMLESIGVFMDSKQADRLNIRMATVDPNYDLTKNYVNAILDGEDTLNYKGFSWVKPYVPQAGDRVVLLPINNTYVILGAVSSIYTPAIQYAEYYLTKTYALSTGWTVHGGWTESSRSVNCNFAQVGTGTNAVVVNETGYYGISITMVPTDTPGVAGLVGRVNGEVFGSHNTGDPQVHWELAVGVPAMYVQSGGAITVSIKNSDAFYGTTRIRLIKHT